jgi:hypothetical protein
MRFDSSEIVQPDRAGKHWDQTNANTNVCGEPEEDSRKSKIQYPKSSTLMGHWPLSHQGHNSDISAVAEAYFF